MSSAMQISAVSKTDPGRVREINEDTVLVHEEFGLVVLADGMGGYNSGEVASQLAAEQISTQLLPCCMAGDGQPFPLESAVSAANEAILDAVDDDPDYEGMATTVVTAVFASDRVHFAHVGDSRIYRFRDGRLERLTRDHSMIEALIDDGMFESVEEALEAGVKNNVLLRGLGIAREVEVDVDSAPLSGGDVYLFCSDGLSNMVKDDDMERILREQGGGLSGQAEQLLAAALDNGGLDNVSLALVRIEG